MIKHVFIFQPSINMIEADRWYFRYHSKEVVRFIGPWLRRYETYRAYDAPATADKYGVRRGRLTELWFNNVPEFIEAGAGGRPYTAPANGWDSIFGDLSLAMVPVIPTEDFLKKEPTPEETTVLRWCMLIRYPKGVPAKEGDDWYVNVFAQEAKQQPGLLKFVSHRGFENPPISTSWQRMTEMWYQDFNAWQKAVIESPVKYTKPPWGGDDPFVGMVSTFVPYKPDVDFLKDNPQIP
jgi:hypothetical protein